MVAENISIVAAVELLDEQLVDAQESSTRYQDFTRRRYYTPPEIAASPLADDYAATCEQLFATYTKAHRALVTHLESRFADRRPPDLPDDEYRRTLRARAFDSARYLLPASTYTGLGYLCSARTLERQISRLASHQLAEVRAVADELRNATTQPAYNPLALRIAPELQAFLDRHPEEGEDFAAKVRDATLTGAAAAPTLVRYTQAQPYLQRTYADLRGTADRILCGLTSNVDRGVELADPTEPRLELAATLLYRASNRSYRQVMEVVRGLPEVEVDAIIDRAFAARGPHDEPIRETRVGYQLVFDVCLDNGAFRDLHRHRNCVQILQDFNASYGYDVPDEIAEAGLDRPYHAAMARAGELALQLDHTHPGVGQYVLPLAYRRRALFKMEAAELGYIVETRTKPAGHFSYRDIAYRMFTEFQAQHPSLARYIRVTDPSAEDFFER
jgi:thymidylate synthase ThyX